MSGAEYVFGYGSLVLAPGGYVTELAGHERHWGVAMDNARDLAGYKYFLAPDDTRPPVFVAFLDVAPCAEAAVNGVCTPVDPGVLAGLDARERNYERVEVTPLVADVGGRTWAYVGSAAGRERFARGRAASSCVVADEYLRLVSDAFRALGETEYDRAAASLDPGGLPVRPLRRVDL